MDLLLLDNVGFEVLLGGPGELLCILCIPPSHLKTPFVTDLPGQVEVHFGHKESVTGSGQAW